ncbi:AAA family ATPase [Roseomonas aeriglobus]|nr:AAA family ATPase [Roseomonas aeriglobus]
MALTGRIDVPSFGAPVSVEVSAGSSIVFVGANGAGKTRLGVYLDTSLSQAGLEVHRIAAHRSLTLNPAVVPPSLEIATNRLFYGYDQGNYAHKYGHRYQNKPETALLSDFDHVLAALYAENNDVSIKYRQDALSKPDERITPTPAKVDKLKSIWEKLLPHRELIVLGGNLRTKPPEGDEYSASDMSDGERVTLYLIAQALLAKPDTLLIFDEPELHINRSILAKLWDEIESARPDCCFLYITHDVEFASSRHAASKYALRAFRRAPGDAWDIEQVPESSELPDDIVATIVGSRRPVLFVEGDGGSLDSALYRRVYDKFTVVPVGSCEQVIHTVSAFAARPELHRVGCAGLVDADGRTDEEAAYLETKGVYRLPVSEIENVLLLPGVFLALAASLKFSAQEGQAKLTALKGIVFAQAAKQVDEICLRYTRRRVDAQMKKIGLSGSDIGTLDTEFRQAASSVDPSAIFGDAKAKLTDAISNQEYEKVLLAYDNKGLLSEVAKQLGYQQKALEEFVGRTLRSDDSSVLHSALKDDLPAATPRP